MQRSDSPVRCPECGGRSRISVGLRRAPEGHQQRYRQCRRCSETWVTVEMSVEDHRETYEEIEDLRGRLAQAKLDLQAEREARMKDIRTSVRSVGKYADRDPVVRLFVEYMKARAEFLSSSGQEPERRLQRVS